jgi:hypothetical protein
MAKEIRTEAEIATLIQAEMKQYDVCKGVGVLVVRIPDDGFTNWEVNHARGSGTPVLPDCRRVINNAVLRLRER